jgi:hypothetical protein
MEGRDNLELELIDHIGLKVDSTNNRSQGQLSKPGLNTSLRICSPRALGQLSAMAIYRHQLHAELGAQAGPACSA